MTDTATVTKPSSAVITSVRKFVAAHGGSATAVLQPIGRIGVRITLVGADGVLGDRVVDDLATAKAVVEAVEGVTETEHWDRDTSAAANPARGHWAKMAGWVAHQSRFPRARNER
ncbi:hypothetical protein NDR87_22550 [Nocardia sp. CDC159]|uniref:Uncharacterized protein n=1 Tax=Nocardia pulmonis TaxID=2951408 RepID=A0A9X2EC10_9NOCA|nr:MULTISPECIES: hypothetical protein [Nocardia]MCM6776700.1 hypothetical protein [Nocardia pulmonis]MCM6789151.1 hypothetical protein [Nocardia sp. CDC159]